MSIFKNNTKTESFNIEGMHCEMCSSRLKKGLEATSGIKSAEVSLENKKAEITFDEKKISKEEIIAKVSEIGYEASV